MIIWKGFIKNSTYNRNRTYVAYYITETPQRLREARSCSGF